MMDSLEILITKFHEENKKLIETKLESVNYKLDDISKKLVKIEDLEKRIYAMERHPFQCDLKEKTTQLRNDVDDLLKENLPERMVEMEKSKSNKLYAWSAFFSLIGKIAIILGAIISTYKLAELIWK